MANKKTGFLYWSIETDRYQDMKIKRLKKELKGTGVAVYDYILNEIYRDKGCYLEWDASTAFDVAEFWDIKETALNEIINYCCHLGLFNKELMANERIISSKAILDRYIDWSTKAKRVEIIIPEKLKILQEEPAKLPEECNETSDSLPQHNITQQEVTKRKRTQAAKPPDDPLFTVNLIKEKFSEAFLSTWLRWKDYKLKEFKFQFKSQESEAAAITELFNLAGGKEITAGAIIHQSMANGWKGFFELKKNNDQPGNQNKTAPAAPPVVDHSFKFKQELEYLYTRFLEDQCTVITIETYHYDFLKARNMVSFSQVARDEISKLSNRHIEDKKLSMNEKTLLTFMKKFGVLELFKSLREQGKEAVFQIEHGKP